MTIVSFGPADGAIWSVPPTALWLSSESRARGDVPLKLSVAKRAKASRRGGAHSKSSIASGHRRQHDTFFDDTTGSQLLLAKRHLL